jgi:single-strand DNA-binding protein
MAKGTWQKTTIVGNLGQDPDVRATASGTAVANLSVGVTDYVGKDQSGQPKHETEWFRVVVFGAMADNAAKFLSKGAKILVSGRMKTKKWQDQSGVDRYTTELVADDMQFMGGGQQQGQAGGYQQPQNAPQQPQQQSAHQQPPQRQAATQQAQAAPQQQAGGFEDDDIPW